MFIGRGKELNILQKLYDFFKNGFFSQMQANSHEKADLSSILI